MRIPVPFEGFTVPGAPYLAVLLVGAALVGWLVYVTRPRVDPGTVLAMASWMVTGAALHVLYGLGGYPSTVAPLFSAPAVYLTTGIGMGAVWGVAARSDRTGTGRVLGAGGGGLAAVAVAAVLWRGSRSGDLAPLVPLAGVCLAALLTVVVHRAVAGWRPRAVAETGRVGALVIFAHLLDGVTTALGVDLLGAVERSALPARIMEFAAGLPTAAYVGSGWLFVAVKLAVAVGVVVLFGEYVREQPTEGYLLLGLIAAVGLGPGTHNVLIFMLL